IVFGIRIEPGNGGADAGSLGHELFPVPGFGRMSPAQQGFNFPTLPTAAVGVGGVVFLVPTADIALSRTVYIQHHIVLPAHFDTHLLVLHGTPGVVVPVTVRVAFFQAQLVDVVGVERTDGRAPGNLAIGTEQDSGQGNGSAACQIVTGSVQANAIGNGRGVPALLRTVV